MNIRTIGYCKLEKTNCPDCNGGLCMVADKAISELKVCPLIRGRSAA